jgi:hypothetical protein
MYCTRVLYRELLRMGAGEASGGDEAEVRVVHGCWEHTLKSQCPSSVFVCEYCQEAEKERDEAEKERDEAVMRHRTFFNRIKQKGGMKKKVGIPLSYLDTPLDASFTISSHCIEDF